jgi:3'(2'), 5'-bisphosphate nucleotidase
MAELAEFLDKARAAALAAGAVILEIYRQPFAVEQKADASPVTQADRRAEAIIVERLRAATPEIPIVAEELAAAGDLPRVAPERFWLVDPLDGTREFIRRNGEFTVNIALIERGDPVLGVVHVPTEAATYWAAGSGAWRQRAHGAPTPIAARSAPAQGAIVVHSRSHVDEQRLAPFIATIPEAKRRISGSSVKFCLLAAGEADLYPRFGRTMEWDTAAGQAVLEGAGGRVTTFDGTRLRYGKPGFANPDFIARGREPPPVPSSGRETP